MFPFLQDIEKAVEYYTEDNQIATMAKERYLVEHENLQFQVCFCGKCGNYMIYSNTTQYQGEEKTFDCKC